MNRNEQVFICAIHKSAETSLQFEHRIAELVGLCAAAGADVERVFSQERQEPHRSLYVGSGKAQEIAEAISAGNIGLVVCDGDLTPTQVRNLEAQLSVRVIDRTQLILDIFALRAQTREGRLQVEIAQLQYLLPRLAGTGAQMSRLGGGIGTRGPGETKLESDRRRIRRRIAHLEDKLSEVRRHRQTQRRKRSASVPVVALVGYTNAGKTTVLNRWTRDKGGLLIEEGDERLFDTLNPVARRVNAGVAGNIVVMDTVGFVQNLPHLLVDAFQSTLEEVNVADLIVQVVDSSVDVALRLDTTYQVLSEISALDKPIITFFNKVDLARQLPPPDARAEGSIYGSAKNALNMEDLYQAVESALGLDLVQIEVQGNANSKDFWNQVMTMGRVVETKLLSDEQIFLTMEVERRNRIKLANLQEAEQNSQF